MRWTTYVVEDGCVVEDRRLMWWAMGNLLDLHDSPLSHFAIPSVDTHKMDDWWMTYERTTYVTDDL